MPPKIVAIASVKQQITKFPIVSMDRKEQIRVKDFIQICENVIRHFKRRNLQDFILRQIRCFRL